MDTNHDKLASFAGLNEAGFTSVLEAALEYKRRGLNPTPLYGKEPLIKGWPKRELAEDELPVHFFEGRNIGIVLGGDVGLVDVDLDSPMTIRVAQHLLPGTLTSGRDTNVYSHWWYLCGPTPSSRTYSLPKAIAERLGVYPSDATLVELRSTGRQTAVAPSTHPEDGDKYIWHQGEIRKVAGNALERLIKEVAAATRVALHWPLKGARQSFVLHAAGYLGRHMEHDRVEAILTAAALAVEDEEHTKRSQAVQDTLRRLKGARR